MLASLIFLPHLKMHYAFNVVIFSSQKTCLKYKLTSGDTIFNCKGLEHDCLKLKSCIFLYLLVMYQILIQLNQTHYPAKMQKCLN